METLKINTLRYGLPGLDGINLYKVNDSTPLTLGQLVIALCAQSSALNEARAVIKMNVIAERTGKINRLSELLEGILNGSISWLGTRWFYTISWEHGEEIYNELTEDFGITGLPLSSSGINTHLEIGKKIKEAIQNLSFTVQKDNVTLQTQVSRRDVTMTTASNVVGSLMGSCLRSADKLA